MLFLIGQYVNNKIFMQYAYVVLFISGFEYKI